MAYIDYYGYRHFYAPDCSRKHKDENAKEHFVVAERALGKPLPKKAQVHHFDENKKNNKNTNLIICENQAYHSLLHVRQRVAKAGGNPDTDKICYSCKEVKYQDNFFKDRNRYLGITDICKSCYSEVDRSQYPSRQ